MCHFHTRRAIRGQLTRTRRMSNKKCPQKEEKNPAVHTRSMTYGVFGTKVLTN